MANRRLLGLILLLAAALVLTPILASGARAADDEKPIGPLAWKFDKPFNQTWVTKTKQTVTVSKGTEGQSPVTYASEATLDVTWTPEKAKPESKEQNFTLKINSLKLTTKVGDQEVTVPGKGNEKLPASGLTKALKDATIKVKFDTANMKAEVSGLDDFLKRLDEKDRAAVSALLSKEALTRQVEFLFPALPAKMGEKTELPGHEFSSGKYGKFTAKTTYTYKDASKKKANLESVSEWTLAPAEGAIAGVTVDKAEPAQVKFTGTATFDPSTGRMETVKLEGKAVKQKLTLKVDKDTLTADVLTDYSFTATDAKSSGTE